MAKQEKLQEMHLAKPMELKTEAVTLNVIGKLPKAMLERQYLILEPKLDGLRGAAIVRNGKCKLYTSGGVEVVNGPRIISNIEFAAINPVLDNRVYDGEFFTDDWNKTSSLVKTQSVHKDAKKLCFRVFDTVSLIEWKKEQGTNSLAIRKKLLHVLSLDITGAYKNVSIMPSTKLKISKLTHKQIQSAIAKFFQACVAAGHEGAVVKDPDSVYAFKKNKDWLKLKPFYSADLKVAAVKEGTGRNKGRLGAFICIGRVDGKKVSTQVGGGLTDALRTKFWKQHKKGKLIGSIIEVIHEGITVQKAVRFPRFMRVRWDKSKPN